MGILSSMDQLKTVKVSLRDGICTIQIHRPEANNTINDLMVDEFARVLEWCETEAKIVILEGLPEVFSFGADFSDVEQAHARNAPKSDQGPEPLYDVWLKLASGPFITIAHVRGKVNAGGVGFVAACDIVLSDTTTVFSLSELLFGLMPACVLPFLIKRTGLQKAHYLTLMTQPFSAEQAHEWGLVDAIDEKSEHLLRRHLLRLKRLDKTAVRRYKEYMLSLDDGLHRNKAPALAANMEVFSDERNLALISRYVTTGKFPWEAD